MQQTNDGGYIIAGRQGIGIGVANILLVKTDSMGQVEWDKFIGDGATESWAYAVRQTADSGYIICGHKRTGADNSLYLLKTDNAGDTVWTKLYDISTLSEEARDIQQTYDGGYIICGHKSDTVAWLLKTDASGDTVWTRSFFPPGSIRTDAFSVYQCSDSGYVFTGLIGLPGVWTDVYIVRTNANGDTLWTQTVGGVDTDKGEAIQQCTDGGFVVAGLTYSFGAGSYDVYLMRLNASGDTLWTRTYGDVNSDEGYSVEQTNDGGFYYCRIYCLASEYRL